MTTLSTSTTPYEPAIAAQPDLARAGQRDLLSPVIARVFSNDSEYQQWGQSLTSDGLRDYLYAAEDEPHDPADIFRTLRWGGQFIYASLSGSRVRQVAEEFRQVGFVLERKPGWILKRFRWFWPIGRRVHFFAARKVQLLLPGEFTDRSTYRVELVRELGQDALVVQKTVPTIESVVARLKSRWPDAAPEMLERRARKFTEKIFPTFLTREAAILKILEEHLPSRYAARVPKVVSIEKDIRGFVTCLKMNWLRNGGTPLSQLEFATQAADLLRAVHDSAGVIHLDLRLDNMVITRDGVGFVDFGSAVRIGEDLTQNPLLGTLFDELMRTSHIQKMLYSMTRSGQVTAEHLRSQHGRVDKAIDLFFLAVQFASPHGNPDLAGLIHFDPTSDMAQELGQLSTAILRPHDPSDTSHRSAKDILRSLEIIDRDLSRKARHYR